MQIFVEKTIRGAEGRYLERRQMAEKNKDT